jgi:thioesterase domain-containing protein
LVAIRLLSRIKRTFGVELQLAELLAVPTLAEMARLVDERRTVDGGRVDGAQPVLVDFAGDAGGLPIHVVHGAGGGVMFLWALARALSGSRRIVGVQAWGLDGREPPDGSIDAMAGRYATALCDAGPGPYVLAGYSGGGLVALEMAAQLRARGRQVLTVMLLDSVPPGRAEPQRSRRLRSLVGHLAHGRWSGAWPYLRALAANGFHRPPLVNHVDEGYQVDLFDHFSTVAQQHRLGTYGGRIDLFKADRVWPIQPWDYYWGPHVSGELHVTSVPGDHFSMFSPALVGQLADAMSRAATVVDP